MNRAHRRLSEAQQHREIVAASKRPWEPMVLVERSSWPPFCQAMTHVQRLWRNNKFLCMEFPPRHTAYGLVRHLAIQRTTGERVVRWGPLQRIKNETVGPEAVAVELYPAAAEVVEDVHVYHLWVLPPRYPLPGVGLGGS